MRIELLDHGYIDLVDSWGSEEQIIAAARMSTNKGFQGWGPFGTCEQCGCRWRDNQDGTMSLADAEQRSCESCELAQWSQLKQTPGDEKLLAYLWKHKHATPFEMCGLTVEVQAPIFVFREWHRHRTQSFNELSARYTPLPDVNYVPTVERLMINAGGSNKQAGTISGAAILDEVAAVAFRRKLQARYAELQRDYEMALGDGVPKELARVLLPVGRYSRMRASANLRNWLHFLSLRMAPNAQWEIRRYANALGDIIGSLYPRTWALFMEKVA